MKQRSGPAESYTGTQFNTVTRIGRGNDSVAFNWNSLTSQSIIKMEFKPSKRFNAKTLRTSFQQIIHHP